MLDPKEFHNIFKSNGVTFFTGVPDSLLKDYCAYVTETEESTLHIIAANEGGSVGLAIGHYLATGGIPLVYLQNSGLGNIVNPILSLADREVYSIPMVLLIGWRGEPSVKDEPQHVKQGRVQNAILEAMEIPYVVIGPDTNDASTIMKAILQTAVSGSRPVAIVIKKGTFTSYQLASTDLNNDLSRESAINSVLDSLSGEEVIVSTTGMPSRELYELRISRKEGNHRDFLTVGGMGHCSQIALGAALSTSKKVVCIDGDGAILMHMGALPMIGQYAPSNFIHIVLNNSAHDSVGGQPTIAGKIDLTKVATASGYKKCIRVNDSTEIIKAIDLFKKGIDGPFFLEIIVKKGNRENLGRPKTTPIENKNQLMSFINNNS